MPKRKVKQATAITEPNGLLIKQGQGTEIIEVPTAHLPTYGFPDIATPDERIAGDAYSVWHENCKARGLWSYTKPGTCFREGWRQGIEWYKQQERKETL